MAITFSSASNSTSNSNTITSESWSHTIPEGDNRILIVGVSSRNTGAGTYEVSNITYNGTSLTKIRHDSYFNSSSKSSALYYLIAPEVGTYTINVTMEGSVWRIVGGAVSFINVSQIDPIDVHTGSISNTGYNVSTNITPTTANTMIIDCVGGRNGTTTGTVTAGQTSRYYYNELNYFHGACSTKPLAVAAQTTLGWTMDTGTDGWAHSVVALNLNTVPASSQTHQMML